MVLPLGHVTELHHGKITAVFDSTGADISTLFEKFLGVSATSDAVTLRESRWSSESSVSQFLMFQHY